MTQASTDRIRLGATDLELCPLGVGTWAWGDQLFWGYGSSYRDADLEQAFRASLERGVTLFDTAEVYGLGQSEKLLGQFMARDGQSVMLATKFMPFPWRFSPRNLVEALRDSLRRLGLARIDLYQIHWPLPPIALEVWVNALADAVEAGLTRAVGVSNFSLDQTRRAHAALAKRGIPLASNQVQYSLLHRDPEQNGLLQACRDLNVTLIAYSPLGMGLLSGKYTPASPPPGPRSFGAAQKLSRIQPLVQLLRQIGAAHGDKTPVQVALNWTICKGALPIPGAKNIRQAAENAGALGWYLTPAEVEALDAAADPDQF